MFHLSHSLSPYAEERNMLEVTAEAIFQWFIIRKTTKFFLREISEYNYIFKKKHITFSSLSLFYIWKHAVKKGLSLHLQIKTHFRVFDSLLQFSQIIPKSLSYKRGARSWR